jgi:methylmalonyl-CoA mutase N-terminal domain/subunit
MPEKYFYVPDDLSGLDYEADLADPGEYPFTRAVHESLYRGRLWTMRQFAGFGSATDCNLRFKYLLKEGQTGLSVAFHLPTLTGQDSDHPASEGEIGRCGVAVDTLRDMEIIFDGIPLDKVTTSMTINAPAAVLLAMYIAVAERQGVSSREIGGTIQNDILKEYIAQNTYIFPPEPSLRIIVDIFEFCSHHVPQWNTISISGYHIREAGATAVQELAFTLADGMTYVEAGIKRGLDVDSFAPRLSFFFDIHNDFFEEIAKLRAARRIWARVMREKFGAKNPRSWMLRCHAQTAGCSLTWQQPENNVVRVALQALAAVLGGVQSLHTNSRDEALCLPTEEAVIIALRTQQIIAHESGITQAVDPLGGSYFIESITNQMENEAYAYFERIEALGGMKSAIEKGFPQREIAHSASQYQRQVDSKQQIVVGVNEFVSGESPAIPKLSIDPEVARLQVERLKEVKASRDNAAVKVALHNLEEAASSDANLMPPILEAVKAYASIGEICGVLRDVFGEYRFEGMSPTA